jgi:hypothetical protein
VCYIGSPFRLNSFRAFVFVRFGLANPAHVICPGLSTLMFSALLLPIPTTGAAEHAKDECFFGKSN